MFDLGAALIRYNGRHPFDELQEILRLVRREHLAEISPEIGTHELLSVAKQQDWIREDEAGYFFIQVPCAA